MNGWISVRDKLPKENEPCLVKLESLSYYPCASFAKHYYNDKDKWHVKDKGNHLPVYEWMPYPN